MKRKIIAVTACATGVAHTYMAAQALKKAAQKKGYLIKVETQGATGIENELTEKDVKIGEVVIFAVDTKVRNASKYLEKGHKVKLSIRFKGRQIAHPELAEEVLNKFASRVESFAIVEQKAKLEGRNMTMLLAPNTSK